MGVPPRLLVSGLAARSAPSGGALDPQLAFTNGFDDSGDYTPSQVLCIERAFEYMVETFYNDFTVDQDRTGLDSSAAGNWSSASG